jgi:predicted TIM-barrel fold metal-dependent hydrolase
MSSVLPAEICDAHHHLWDLPHSHYLVEQLRADLASVPNVKSTVFVECDSEYRSEGPEAFRPVGETEFVAGCTKGPEAKGIVAQADLRLGAVFEEVLAAHVEAGQGRFRGIRQRATWDPHPEMSPFPPDPGPGLLRDPEFREGFSVLTRAGHSFDAWVFFEQLPEVAELARAFPDARVILNHLGGPIAIGPYKGKRNEVLERWRELLPEVAACPNVWVKLGGIGMPLYGMNWHKEATKPDSEAVAAFWRNEIRFTIEAFGVDRCLFESNFPVDAVSMSYATLWEAFSIMTSDFSESERAALFHDTACDVYGLADS